MKSSPTAQVGEQTEARAYPLRQISLSPPENCPDQETVRKLRMNRSVWRQNFVLRKTQWVDQDREDRDPGREQTEENFAGLDHQTKRNIFTLLRWPESNINTAAQLLTTLKNRPNRYPTLLRVDFVQNENAVGVVASEYNLGPSDSTAAEASPSPYGGWVWDRLNSDRVLSQFFPAMIAGGEPTAASPANTPSPTEQTTSTQWYGKRSLIRA